jgi:hypothetical protein
MAGVSGGIVWLIFLQCKKRIILGSKCGNCSSAMVVNRINDRPQQSAPLYAQTGELHWSFAHS